MLDGPREDWVVGWLVGWVGGIPLIELKNQRSPFQIYFDDIPYSRFSRIDKTDIMDFRHTPFPFVRFSGFGISKSNISSNESGNIPELFE